MGESFIFNQEIRSSDKDIKYYSSKEDAEYFDSDENPRIQKETNKTLAKIINQNSHLIYQIKLANNKTLFNPYSKLDKETSYSFLDNTTRSSNKFANVNEKIMNYYLLFIKTGNKLWLTKAERERI